MSGIIDQVWQLAVESMDVLLVVALVVLVQACKRVWPKAPPKAWMPVMVMLGFLLAWIKVPVVAGHMKQFISEGIKYAAGAELCYQAWRTISAAVRARIGTGVPKEPKGKG